MQKVVWNSIKVIIMDIGSKVYDVYSFWVDNFNSRKKDDKELFDWLREQIKYDCGVVQINKYDGETIDD